jgi:hypothetical protein
VGTLAVYWSKAEKLVASLWRRSWEVDGDLLTVLYDFARSAVLINLYMLAPSPLA